MYLVRYGEQLNLHKTVWCEVFLQLVDVGTKNVGGDQLNPRLVYAMVRLENWQKTCQWGMKPSDIGTKNVREYKLNTRLRFDMVRLNNIKTRVKDGWHDTEESEEQYVLNDLTRLIWVFESMILKCSYEFRMMKGTLNIFLEQVPRKLCINIESTTRSSQFSYTVIIVTWTWNS